MPGQKIRVLVAKPGLDGHDRGAKIIARALRDAGMEVIYTGLRQTPEQIVNAALQEDAAALRDAGMEVVYTGLRASVPAIAAAAIQEDVDVIGLSILSGAHESICKRLMSELDDAKIPVIVGGIIPDKDIPELKEIGIAEIFPPGSSLEEIVKFVQDRVKKDRVLRSS